jgi:SAM-dependent methyltransferase
MSDEKRIKEQIEYYRARAPEYDEWHLRQGRYDRGEEHQRQWADDINQIRQALETARPGGDIVELACGTGWWTEQLLPYSDTLTAVDVSPEVLEINRHRVKDPSVHYIETDLFSWKPVRRFDFVFFSFWLSHVPAAKFAGFWDMVNDALKPDGKAFFIDSLFTQESTAKDQEIDHRGTATRTLNDGREFEIVKEFYDPPELEQNLMNRGWKGYVRPAENFFLYGCVSRP